MNTFKKTIATVLVLLLLLPLCAPALAAEEESLLVLPEDLTRIEDLAFTRVEADTVRFPDGIEFIADNAFGTGIKTWRGAWNNPVARAWCDGHGWTWEPEHCYAVVVGNSNYDVMGTLPSTLNDARAVTAALQRVRGDWQVTELEDATMAQVREAIKTTFADATEADLCLFYFSGHGDESYFSSAGTIFGITSIFGFEAFDGEADTLTPGQLRDCLAEATPGPVTVLIDACGSGAMIYEHYDEEPDDFAHHYDDDDDGGAGTGDKPALDPDNFNRAFLDAFSAPAPSDRRTVGELRDPEKFSVLTACAFSETSMGSYLTEESVNTTIAELEEDPARGDDDDFVLSLPGSAFTYALIQSMGMRFPDCAPDDSLSGDSDRDGLLTLTEAYRNVTAILQDIEAQWYRLVDYLRTISSDDELTDGGEHTIDELYSLHSQTPRYAGYGESVLFRLPA